MIVPIFSFFCFFLDKKAAKSQGFGFFPTSLKLTSLEVWMFRKT